ncbi:DUF3280 domain-containing protein [Paraburkholderia sediminicola]|uniref:DUF3280 domain-containing protein n=1 Tax=Paraburkholderia rhynchosiae TaxID=487049 RepID=A0ACC7N6J5_9BURK
MKQPFAWRAAFVRGAGVLCAAAVSVAGVGFAAEPVRAGAASIAVMNCGLIDDNAAYNDAETNRIQQARIDMISNALRAQLDASQRYRVADNGRAADLIGRLGATQDLSTCDNCARQVGRELGVELVGICWVQKVSNLILNLNLRVKEVASGKTLFQRSVDIRGNTDLSWRRGASALVGLLIEQAPAGSPVDHAAPRR